MSEFLNFLVSYKEIILISLSILLSLLTILLKNKPKTLDDFKLAVSEVLSLVPELVSKVERVGCGSQKKEEVISTCLNLVHRALGRSLSNSEIDYIRSEVSESIEEVLSTPKKKC